jgi:hypothetical protein
LFIETPKSTADNAAILTVKITPVRSLKTMMDDMDTQQPFAESTAPRLARIGLPWKKILAGVVLLEIIGGWIFMVRMIRHIPARAYGLRSSIFIGTVLFTVIGFVVERYLLPGMMTRVAKKLVLFLIVALVALYVFYPAIEYFRGDDDIYLASMVMSDGRKIQDAQKLAGSLNILTVNQTAYRVEVSKSDYERLRRHRYTVVLLQSPAQQYKVGQINARPPGVPDRYVEQMIHSISSDSLLFHIRMLERFGTRADHTPQVDSAADYIVNVMKRYGLEVESLPFYSPDWMYVDEASSRIVSRNICGTLKGTGPSNAECIIVGHFDSVHQGPGGNDNASGVAAVLEAARICSRFSFALTIRFLAVGSEEVGLIGSYHYAQEAKSERRNIISVVNGDMLGYPVLGDAKRLVVAGGTKWNALMDSTLVYNRRYNLNFVVDAHTSVYGGSDQESFLRAGYTAVEISEGSALEIWSGMDPYYHSPFDTSDKLNADLLRHCAQLMMATTAEMAEPLASRTGQK